MFRAKAQRRSREHRVVLGKTNSKIQIDVIHPRHSGLELFQPVLDRLPVSEGCVRATSNSKRPPTQPALPPPPPPPPAAHACLASRQNAVRIRLDNQRRSTFRLAQPQGPLFLLTAALQSAAVKPKSESSRTGEKKKSVRRFAAAGTNPHSPGSSEQRSEVNERYGSGSPAHKSL